VILFNLVVDYLWVLCALIYSFPGKAVGVSICGKTAAAAPVEAAPAKEVCVFYFFQKFCLLISEY
jgi:hypothetical protein